MKTLIKKKWFRRLCQSMIVVISLIVLIFVIVNLWGARVHNQFIARMKDAGRPTTYAEIQEIQNDMPPDSENFAMTPFLKQARLELQSSPPGTIKVTDSASEKLQRMYDDTTFESVKRKLNPGEGPKFDFSLLPENGPYGRTAASYLAEYDRVNAVALRELEAGMLLPFNKQPLISFGELSWAFEFKLRDASKGLTLRALAALGTGDTPKAAESIAMILRLGELSGSRGLLIPRFSQTSAIRGAKTAFEAGLENHQWSEDDLQWIRSAFARIDLRTGVLRSFDLICLYQPLLWSEFSENRQRYRDSMQILMYGPSGQEHWLIQNWPLLITSLLPKGWFQMKGVAAAEFDAKRRTIVEKSTRLSEWYDFAKVHDRLEKPRTRLSKLLMIEPVQGKEGWMVLNDSPWVEVLRQQALLACDLEFHWIRNANYPDDLAALNSTAMIDPITAQPFYYHRTDDSYVLYSIGANGKDDGGKQKKNMGDSVRQPDWVW